MAKKPILKKAARPAAVPEPPAQVEEPVEEVVEDVPTPEPELEPVAELEPEPAVEATASDRTVPGGRYLVNGVFVNANGEPIE